MSLRIERDRALFLAYNEGIRTNTFKSQDDAFDYARKSPAPRFYIDGRFCGIVIARILRGADSGINGGNSRKKFEELTSRYLSMLRNPKYKHLSSREICDIIVEQPAPEFYISRRSARDIISKERKALWKRRYRHL